MFTRDPEQAAERAKELDRDRAYERATLKHRGTNKWTKQAFLICELYSY
jgi:U3 small nucleolar RNA-associated protein 14